jgi:hypothetical protein
MLQIEKRDKTYQLFNINKIKNAILKTDNININIDIILDKIIIELSSYLVINIEELQDIVEKILVNENYNIGKKYILYRKYRETLRNNNNYNLSKIKDDVITNWGPIGYITFKRTYARYINDTFIEEFRDTILRVLQACQVQLKVNFTIEEYNLAYKYMMSLKGSVAGRFLWQLGTKTVDKLGLMSLQNCAFIKINEPIQPFLWIFDVLMLGTGVGVNIQNEYVSKLPLVLNKKLYFERKDTKDADFIIPDSREGWVSLLEKILEAFYYKGKSFTFSTVLIRSAGSKISSFGGIASGPEDLCIGIQNIINVLNNKIGCKLSSVDCLDIVDIIASIVISGNVRRSAIIMIGDYWDDEYLNCKRWDTGLIPNWRSNSNNSVVVSDISKLSDEFWNNYKGNGEPFGLINLELSRKCGRIKDGELYPDPYVEGYNPCLSADTLIAVADGRGAVTIKQLADEGKDVPVYSVNEEGIVEIKWGRHPRVTGENKKMVKVILDDNTFIKTTLNHKFRLIDGTVIKAKDLEKGMSLTRLNKVYAKVKQDDDTTYIRVNMDTTNTRKSQLYEHRLIAKFNDPNKFEELFNEGINNGIIKGNVVVHHKDYNGLNNCPDNLEIMTFKEHSKFHGEHDQSGENNGMYGKKHSEETKALIGAKSKERCTNPEYTAKLSLAQKKSFENNPELKSKSIENMKNTQQKEYKKWCDEIIETTDLNVIMVDGVLKINKNCENCKKEFIVSYNNRECCYCSLDCSNTSSKAIENRRVARNVGLLEKQKQILHNQIMIYKDLQDKLKRDPMKKEWENLCRDQSIPFRIRHGDNGGNEYALKSYKELKEKAIDYNHRVKSIEFLEERETVYNITVDDNHTVGIFTTYKNFVGNGIFVFQCGEQSLNNNETCCLSEIFLPNIENYDELKNVTNILYRICKHSLMLDCHHEETKKIVHKNMRMGIGITGYMMATEEQKSWLSPLYEYIREYDKNYSIEHNFNPSVKLTTVKPSGTLSILAGVTPGAHPGIYKYFIRRIRISSSNPLVKLCKENGYKIEYQLNFDGTDDKNTSVIEFPCCYPEGTILAKDMTAIDQLETIKKLQNEWSDNAVSVTIYYRLEELEDIKKWLIKNYKNNIKSCSFLLHNDHGFKQAPYEEITEEEYNNLRKNTIPIKSGYILPEDDVTLECTGNSCPIK